MSDHHHKPHQHDHNPSLSMTSSSQDPKIDRIEIRSASSGNTIDINKPRPDPQSMIKQTEISPINQQSFNKKVEAAVPASIRPSCETSSSSLPTINKMTKTLTAPPSSSSSIVPSSSSNNFNNKN